MQPPSDISFDCGLDAALYLIDRGLSVFPLKPDRRNPGKFCPRDVSPYENTASTRDDVHKLFGRYDKSAGVWRDRGHGVGIDCGNLVAIDLDNKDGKNGSANFASLVDGLDLETPRTLKFRTPTGGEHLVYRASNPIRNSAGKLAEGVDTRGRHGYLATIGTERADGSYTISDIAEIADCPEELEEYIRGVVGSPRRKDRKARDLDTVVETPETLSEAARLLQETETDEYGGYNDTMYRLAARLGDMGLAQETTLELFEEFWLLKPAHRELKPDEIDQVIENAYRYRADPVGKSTTEGHDKRVEQSLIEDFGEPKEGAAAPEDDFDPVSAVEDNSEVKVPGPQDDSTTRFAKHLAKLKMKSGKRRFSVEPNRGDGVDSLLEENFLLEDVLDNDGVIAFYGESMSRKTFSVLSLCQHIVRGWSFGGLEVERGSVFYVAAEGGGVDMLRRLAAWEKANKVTRSPHMHVINDAPDLSRNPWLETGAADHQADIWHLAALIRDILSETAQKPALIVLDTLSATIRGEENSNSDVATYIRNLDMLSKAIGCPVAFIHHPGKDTAKGMRGASAFKGNVYNIVKVTKGEGKLAPTQWHVEKRKFGAADHRINFTPEVVDLGEATRKGEPTGRRISTLVLNPAGSGQDLAPVAEHQKSSKSETAPFDPSSKEAWMGSWRNRIAFSMLAAEAAGAKPERGRYWKRDEIARVFDDFDPRGTGGLDHRRLGDTLKEFSSRRTWEAKGRTFEVSTQKRRDWAEQRFEIRYISDPVDFDDAVDDFETVDEDEV